MTQPLCFVTGASTGLGRAIALKAAHAGYDVIIHYAHYQETAEAVLQDVREIGAQGYLFKCDFVKDDIKSQTDIFLSKLGKPLTAVVLNAGMIPPRTPLLEDQHYASTFNVNVKGTFESAQAVVNYLHNPSSMVLIGSHAAQTGGRGHAAYAMSKAAVERFVQSLSFELGPKTRVNGVSPGVIESDRHEKDWLESVSLNIPLKRPGKATEVADTVLWLLSEQSSYVNGAIIPVTGGRQ